MKPSRVWLLFAVYFLFTGSTIAMDPEDRDPKDIKASEVFEMIPAGKPGSCANQPIDQIVQEAALLAQNAVRALEKLVYSSSVPANDENEKILNMAYVSFGARYDIDMSCEGDTDENDDELAPLKIKNRKSSLKMGEKLSKLECGDGDLRKVTTLGDLGLKPKDKTIKQWREEKDPQRKNSEKDVDGYYLHKYFSPLIKRGMYNIREAVLSFTNKPGEFAKRSPCESLGGYYSGNANLILLCDEVFQLKTLEQAIKDQNHVKEEPDMDHQLDAQDTSSAVLLHEVIHKVNRRAFDKKRAEDTVINADNYKMFAKGITLSKINWYPKGYDDNVGL
ncbi:hypothetical protein NUU61_004499 [Penicillium alfredii]|uniref:Lysine-specific metallo-endopeptidase domain-containing protein n=1 Tax=Penicillium alfredii TaxID=1506179 RepID=A0A9W9FLP9_9EURO|nr:uncharacterized protein NUU61_004499 [Penicillium alfredii]KAJ5102277.1 hypothetical protein NUU61_004499 [Penicillium alfredii]